VHGNGGGTSGGSFVATPAGGRWENAGARLDAALATDAGSMTFTTRLDEHEVPFGVQRTHTTLDASVAASDVRAVQLLLPSGVSDAAPVATTSSDGGVARIDATVGTRHVTVISRGPSDTAARWSGVIDGVTFSTDARDAVFETDGGTFAGVYAEHATDVTVDGVPALTTTTPGVLAVRIGGERVEVVATGATPSLDAARPPAGAGALVVDGVCGTALDGGRLRFLGVDGDLRATVRRAATAGPTNAVPAPPQAAGARVAVGTTVTVTPAVCDADHDPTRVVYSLVSAPAGSNAGLSSAAGGAQFSADRPGPYRVRMLVSDGRGGISRASETLFVAGARNADGMDDDHDGLIDSDDPDGDAGTS
jgi:hypothetical protein